MRTQVNEAEDQMTWHEVLKLVLQTYGPYAFSVASLLTIWLFIVQPQLELQAIDFKNQEAAIDSLQQLNSSQQMTADMLQRTAASLDVVSRTLERTAEKLAKAIE